MQQYNEHIRVLHLYNHAGLSSVCGEIRSPHSPKSPTLFSIRWNGHSSENGESDVPNLRPSYGKGSWTLRGFIFQPSRCFPTYQDALQYIAALVAE